MEKLNGQIGEFLAHLGAVFHRRLQWRAVVVKDALLGQPRKLDLVALLFLFLNGGANDIDLTAVGGILSYKIVQPLAVASVHRVGVHALTPGGHLVNDRKLKVAVKGESQRSRNGRGTHDQHMGARVFVGQRGALRHAEAMLLVGHHKPGVCELHAVGSKRLSSDDNVHRSCGKAVLDLSLLRRGSGSDEKLAGIAQRLEHGLKLGKMLTGKDLRGHHQRRLPAVLHGQINGRRRADRLSATNVAHNNAVHGPILRHILRDLADGTALRPRQTEGQ